MADLITEAGRWLNTAERANVDEAIVPALLGIGYALMAISSELEAARDARPY